MTDYPRGADLYPFCATDEGDSGGNFPEQHQKTKMPGQKPGIPDKHCQSKISQ
ncbi:hypothetical protein [Pseudomonas moorei]|jgi:hypothetical protein|uniref:hypothetical protein n=1 Tax=Pseudomonas moorei TaxID=395599 RepID=UPI001FF5B863|nr:hypothetical protein [Pseudomonas moorei]